MSLHLYRGGSGDLVAEWIRPNYRLLAFLTWPLGNSGWCYVSKSSEHGHGTLLSLPFGMGWYLKKRLAEALGRRQARKI
jgi:hypothetical protein